MQGIFLFDLSVNTREVRAKRRQGIARARYGFACRAWPSPCHLCTGRAVSRARKRRLHHNDGRCGKFCVAAVAVERAAMYR